MVRHQGEPDWVEPTCVGEMKCKSQFLTRFFVYKTIVSQQNLSKLKSFWASKSIQLEGRSNYKSYFSFLVFYIVLFECVKLTLVQLSVQLIGCSTRDFTVYAYRQRWSPG